jgi:CheY-like chemotaxis protein
MLGTNRLLLISDSQSDPWYQIFQEAVTALGTLKMARGEEALRLIRQQYYDLVVIDAARVADAFQLTSSIRKEEPDAKIIIFTASPTWRRAREAFRAGATDYIRKSMNKEDLLSALQVIMGKAPSLWRC